ncbi:uncharacterized protein LOC128548407 [Mercenaria mercenaria]|uniref:uncharacterized protein LOC128548407 n=1 Tax=Mercenaria mercenaria TaxID=6596 RepID=UPI00234F98A3|nr:uncharacterized protein LOC128548407 [Mercenaria mercenaria]
MKFAVVALCTLFVVSARAQSLGEMAMMSALFGGRGSSSTSSSANPMAALASSSSSTNPLAALSSASGGAGNPFAALTSSGSAGANPFASLFGGSSSSGMGGGMGRMAGGMMLGGAEMSHMLDFYSCGAMRLPMQLCFMMMQQNM